MVRSSTTFTLRPWTKNLNIWQLASSSIFTWRLSIDPNCWCEKIRWNEQELSYQQMFRVQNKILLTLIDNIFKNHSEEKKNAFIEVVFKGYRNELMGKSDRPLLERIVLVGWRKSVEHLEGPPPVKYLVDTKLVNRLKQGFGKLQQG